MATAPTPRPSDRGSASCGRTPVYGTPTSDPVRLAAWAGLPSVAYDAPWPAVVEPSPTEGA